MSRAKRRRKLRHKNRPNITTHVESEHSSWSETGVFRSHRFITCSVKRVRKVRGKRRFYRSLDQLP